MIAMFRTRPERRHGDSEQQRPADANCGWSENGLQQAKTSLEDQGFVKIESLLSQDEVNEIAEILDDLLLTSNPSFKKLRRELSEVGTDDRPEQPEFSRPTVASPRLKRSRAYMKCRTLAASLLNQSAFYLFDHAIYKMPGTSAITPWHQDQAYLGPSAVIRSLHFWIPLQDTDQAGGCLRFVPGSHRDVLFPHSHAYHTNDHVLSTTLPRDRRHVDVPMSAGDVSIHTSLTLHSAGANATDGIRRAWILHFGDRPRWYKHLMRVRGMLK